MKGKQRVKFTLEEVSQFFKDRGYTLLSESYEGATFKLRYECPSHKDKELYITLNDLKNNGRGCVYCAGLNKPTINEVEEAFNELGLELLTDVYVNNRTKMPYRCQKHNDSVQYAIYKTIKKGHGCQLCGREKAGTQIRGENNWNWGGGVSEIKHYLRKQLNDWKMSSLKATNFRCDITGEKASDLQIHHLTPFANIRDEVFAKLDIPIKNQISEYSDAELTLITEGIKKRHTKELGVPLRYEIHRLFHSIYGNSNTPEQYYEFKERYMRGEFAEINEKEATRSA